MNSEVNSDLTGFSPVVAIDTDNGTEIGFNLNGRWYTHSACTPAIIEQSKYSWFEYGAPVEIDGAHSIEFYINSAGQESSTATRLDNSSSWQSQTVEDSQITSQVWLNEFPFEEIVSYNHWNGDNEISTLAVLGDKQKKKVFNENTQEFDCIYVNDGKITNNTNCSLEYNLDMITFGELVDSDFYLDALLNGKVTYETDESEIIDDIKRYF